MAFAPSEKTECAGEKSSVWGDYTSKNQEVNIDLLLKKRSLFPGFSDKIWVVF
jgi:hypothetical protein